MCAKTYPALVALRRGFAERTIHKEYRAVVGGSVDGDEGTIDAPLLDSRGEWVSAVTQWRGEVEGTNGDATACKPAA